MTLLTIVAVMAGLFLLWHRIGGVVGLEVMAIDKIIGGKKEYSSNPFVLLPSLLGEFAPSRHALVLIDYKPASSTVDYTIMLIPVSFRKGLATIDGIKQIKDMPVRASSFSDAADQISRLIFDSEDVYILVVLDKSIIDQLLGTSSFFVPVDTNEQLLKQISIIKRGFILHMPRYLHLIEQELGSKQIRLFARDADVQKIIEQRLSAFAPL